MDLFYPRPQMQRSEYQLLDGFWSLNGRRIRVPYPPESAASLFSEEETFRFEPRTEEEELLRLTEASPEELRLIQEKSRTMLPSTGHLVYETDFIIPETWRGQHVLLHFGAVDQCCDVYLNGELLGHHDGGYLPFYFDITKVIRENHTGLLPLPQKLKVDVMDTLDETWPYGKQSRKPGGMWYTTVSGIWKSVWIEPVPESYIGSIRLMPDLAGISVRLLPVRGSQIERFSIRLVSTDDIHKDGRAFTDWIKVNGDHVYLKIKNPHLWTPEDPYLYHLEIRCGDDRILTYFALRTIEVKHVDDTPRVCLNGKPVFLHGVLDQGYYPEGIYLPLHPGQYEADLLRIKQLGFNFLRKHIKIEPEQFYAACDRTGILVMQDMVNSGTYDYFRDTFLPNLGMVKRSDTGSSEKDSRRRSEFIRHTKSSIRQLESHPCIIAWCIFNEGWGQFQADRLYDIVKRIDSTRLVDSTSGWFAQKKSDFDSRHVYFRNKTLSCGELPLLLSECGGYGLRAEGHLFDPSKSSGYGTCKTKEELTDRIMKMYREMVIPAIPKGLCGVVFTQFTDVECEINGLYTYDRAICKVIPQKMLELSRTLTESLK